MTCPENVPLFLENDVKAQNGSSFLLSIHFMKKSLCFRALLRINFSLRMKMTIDQNDIVQKKVTKMCKAGSNSATA